MATVYDVDARELIEQTAEQLKKEEKIKPPAWASFVKTGVHKQRLPVNKDWWYVRSAALLRSVYMLGPIGVSKLRTKYGGKKDRGHKPEKVFKGSGSIIRTALQQLGQAGYVKKQLKGQRKGRIITPEGKSLLDSLATQIMGPKKPTKKAKPKKTKKKSKSSDKKEKKKDKESKTGKKQGSDKKKKPEKKQKKEQADKKSETKNKSDKSKSSDKDTEKKKKDKAEKKDKKKQADKKSGKKTKKESKKA